MDAVPVGDDEWMVKLDSISITASDCLFDHFAFLSFIFILKSR